MTDDDALRALGRLKDLPEMKLVLTPVEAWIVMSNLQLACRHPGNLGPSRHLAEAVARRIQDFYGQRDPELGRLAEQGWHECFDVSSDHP